MAPLFTRDMYIVSIPVDAEMEGEQEERWSSFKTTVLLATIDTTDGVRGSEEVAANTEQHPGQTCPSEGSRRTRGALRAPEENSEP